MLFIYDLCLGLNEVMDDLDACFPLRSAFINLQIEYLEEPDVLGNYGWAKCSTSRVTRKFIPSPVYSTAKWSKNEYTKANEKELWGDYKSGLTHASLTEKRREMLYA